MKPGKFVRWLQAATPLLYLACVGCTTAPGEPLVPVQGRVRLDGQPLTQGNLVFVPVSTDGRYQPTTLIDRDGRYEVNCIAGRKGIPAGRYKVLAFANAGPDTLAADGSMMEPGRSLLPTRYHDAKTTDLTIEVAADAASEAYDLSLSSR